MRHLNVHQLSIVRMLTYFVYLHRYSNAVAEKDVNVALDDDNVIALAAAIEFPMSANAVVAL